MRMKLIRNGLLFGPLVGIFLLFTDLRFSLNESDYPTISGNIDALFVDKLKE